MTLDALFFNHDGVINLINYYVHKLEEFNYIEVIFGEVLHECKHSCKLIEITSQTGIAHGYHTEEQFSQLTTECANNFKKQSHRSAKSIFHLIISMLE